MRKKGQLAWDTMIPWIIAIAVLLLGFILIMVLSGKGSGAIDFIKNLLRFGR